MNQNFFKKIENSKNIGFTIAIYSGVSIIGPLILIGGSGYMLDRYFQSKPILTIVGVFISFIVSNIMLYKKSMALTGYIDSKYNQDKEKKEEID